MISSLLVRGCAFLVVIVLALSAGVSAAAQADAPGAADHPAVARFPGFYIEDHRQSDFDGHEFKTGENAKTGEVAQTRKEGKTWDLRYEIREGQRPPTRLEVIRNYENAFRKAGGSMPWSDPSTGEATFRQQTGTGERWVELQVAPGGDLIRLIIVDVAAMAQKVELSASEMFEAIGRDGYVALNGIEFDTGLATLRKESEPLLKEIEKLLAANSALRLSVQGHTDNVGKPDANLKLSRARAVAVRDWLVARGVQASRLSADGFGDTKPVADNRTEAGRARNRRVELVKVK